MKRLLISPLLLGMFFTAQACSLTPELQGVVVRQEREQNIPNNMLLALISKESSFCASAHSNRGAIGLGQLLPGTALQMQVNPYDDADNIKGAAMYLKRQYNYFGDWAMALAAYNAGPGNVTKYKGIPPFAETRHYVSEILRRVQVYTAMNAAPHIVPAASRLPAQVMTRAAATPMLASGAVTTAAAFQQLQPPTQGVVQTQGAQAPVIQTRSATPLQRQRRSIVAPPQAPQKSDDNVELSPPPESSYVFVQPGTK